MADLQNKMEEAIVGIPKLARSLSPQEVEDFAQIFALAALPTPTDASGLVAALKLTLAAFRVNCMRGVQGYTHEMFDTHEVVIKARQALAQHRGGEQSERVCSSCKHVSVPHAYMPCNKCVAGPGNNQSRWESKSIKPPEGS